MPAAEGDPDPFIIEERGWFMSKKYSIQTENDEIVSVEVDGVAYTDADDIPDEEDREQIKAMISRTEDAQFDKEFEKAFDPETQEEFRKMEKQSAVFPKVFLAIFLGVAVICLTIAGFSAYSAVQTISREQSTPGQVVDLVIRTSRDSQTGDVTEYSYPVVEFTPSGQRTLRVQLSEGASPPDHGVGDAVTILYDPQQPRNARIKSFSSDLLMWILPGITFVVGIVFGGVALAVFKFWSPDKKEAVPA
jgi:hypothetical protein